jgi:hypothetical protein
VGEKTHFYPLKQGLSGKLVGATRFERATNGLKGHCSTVELRARLKNSIMPTHSRQRSSSTLAYMDGILAGQKHPPITALDFSSEPDYHDCAFND